MIHLVNETWKASFAKVKKNKKIKIAECGWGPWNINLLLYKEIQNTMTSDNYDAFKLLKSNFVRPKQHNSFQPPVYSVSIQQSRSTAVSNIHNPVIFNDIYNNNLLSLNYSSGNLAIMKRSWLLGRRRKQHILKRNDDEVINLKIDDMNLSSAQLYSSLNMKKWKTDRSIASYKKIEPLYLWIEWKYHLNEAPQYVIRERIGRNFLV